MACSEEPWGEEEVQGPDARALEEPASTDHRVQSDEVAPVRFPEWQTSAVGEAARVYGAPLASGATPEAAVEAFRARYAPTLGSRSEELAPRAAVRAATSAEMAPGEPIPLMVDSHGRPKLLLYRFAQSRDGVAVYGAELRVLVRNEDPYTVVWASSSLRDLGDFAVERAPSVARAASARGVARSTAEQLASARALQPATGIGAETDLVIYTGPEAQPVPPRLAIQYVVESEELPRRQRVIADAKTGETLLVETLDHSLNVSGSVQGLATVGGATSDCASEVSTPVPYGELRIVNGGSGFSGQDGRFTLVHGGAAAVTVVSTLFGRYFDVVNSAGANAQLALTVLPPGPVNFVHNSSNAQQHLRAQVNAYVAVNAMRDFVLQYLPPFPGVSTQLNYPVTVNSTSSSLCPGNAWHFGNSLVFCAEGGGYTNTAFPAAVQHEYVHELLEEADGGGGAYGEGMADALAALVSGDPEFGRGWVVGNCNQPLRTANNQCQVSASACSSCGSQIHACGQLLSGIIWDIRKRLLVTEPDRARAIVNELAVNLIALHAGSQIDASVAIDLLMLDDDDATLSNGSPHGQEICDGFRSHGIPCPVASNGRPCASYCGNAVAFNWTGSYQSGPLGTGSICRETTRSALGGNCGNFGAGRQLLVNGQSMTCNNVNWSSVPSTVNGGYCIQTTSGNYSYAFFTLW